MALRETTGNSPQRSVSNEISETRFFSTTNASDLPRKGDLAQSHWSGFPAGWVVDNAELTRTDVDEDRNALYEITIVAKPGVYAVGGGGGGEGGGFEDEGNPAIWYTMELRRVMNHAFEEKTTQTADHNRLKLRQYDAVISYYHQVGFYTNQTRNTWFNYSISRLGKRNTLADDPYPGALADSWRLIASNMTAINREVTKIEWVYEHAGTKIDGTFMTWTDRMTLWTPYVLLGQNHTDPSASSPASVAQFGGKIAPMRSNASGGD